MTPDAPARIVETRRAPTDDYCLEISKDFVPRLFEVPADLALTERLMLYTLIVALQPHSVIEIGSFEGGSAAIMASAMDAVGKGKINAIEPHPKISSELMQQMQSRVTLHVGYSPYIVAEVAAAAGVPFDFAFIDGWHDYNQLMKDIEGVLPFLADQAHLLFHDAYYFQVRDAIDEMLRQHSDILQDCGVITRSGVRWAQDLDEEDTIRYGGLRLVVYNKTGFSGTDQ